MKREFIEKVIREKTVNTRKYRYVALCTVYGVTVKRLLISRLETPSSLTYACESVPHGWQIVFTTIREY